MEETNKISNDRLELSPHEWMAWTDEKFNDWRRINDFPRIVAFLFDSLPDFSLWLSEQGGLTKEDLIFHGAARFVRYYGEPVTYVEHDLSISLYKGVIPKKNIRYDFIRKNDKNIRIENFKVERSVRFFSYIDWALKKKINGINDIIDFLTPLGRTADTSDFLNSNSNIQFNIPLYMPNIPIESFSSSHDVKSSTPPRLELLKLGGGNVEVFEGYIGEKNLEFTNIDNLTLISPTITSFQNVLFSTLRNFNVAGGIHAATFYQCSVGINIKDGYLDGCDFEFCESKINLKNSSFSRSSIKERQLYLNLKDTEVTDCLFEYASVIGFSHQGSELFHKAAKMIFSHLGFPDLAGNHFFIERKSKRKKLWRLFFTFKEKVKMKRRVISLFSFLWLFLQELYWGYGEKPFNIILFSMFIILLCSSLGFFHCSSSTYLDIEKSLIFSFQSFTNVSILEIKQSNNFINLIGSFMSFFGLMSVGLLISALSSKTKNYN